MRTLTIAATLVLIATSTHAQVTCQRIGNQTFCSNGQSSQSIGNFDYYSNGGVGQRIQPNQYYYTPPPQPAYQPPIMPQPTPYQRYR